jgi:rhodanese-related sulfurtransferase
MLMKTNHEETRLLSTSSAGLASAHRLGAMLCAWMVGLPVLADGPKAVNISAQIARVTVMHQGVPVVIERNQDPDNMIDPDFSMTSRPCPPYCVQPMHLAPGVETIGELELLDFLGRAGKDSPVLVIDSRDRDWLARSGIIPGATHLAWTDLHPGHTDPEKIAETLILRFGATRLGSLWNFENAKTLVMYCNGPWCGQSPTNIKQLLAMGYPAHKLKWYRGGMQVWKSLGFNTAPLGN